MKTGHDISTRGMILKMLKTKGSLSVSDMARELGITEMGVRKHLNVLEKEELVQPSLLRQTMGRPAHVYALTPQSEQHFPNHYHHLALDLLDEVAEQGGDAVNTLFEIRELKMYSRYKGRMQDKDLAERVTELVDIQNGNGYMAEANSDGKGNYYLHEYNCPFTRVANTYSQICSSEQSLFESLLETQVSQLDCIAKGANKCVYWIPGTKTEAVDT